MRVLAAVALALVAAAPLRAHPHVSFEASVALELADGRCVGFVEEWVFDSFFSAMVVMEHDRDRNGSFDAKENAAVEKGYFSNLRKYGYFTFIRVGDVRRSPDKVSAFQASIRGDRLVYRFRVPLEGADPGREFAIAVFDATFYCAVSYSSRPITFSGGALLSWTVQINEKYPIYYNPMGSASDSTVYSAWRPGLQTAFPAELLVVLGQ